MRSTLVPPSPRPWLEPTVIPSSSSTTKFRATLTTTGAAINFAKLTGGCPVAPDICTTPAGFLPPANIGVGKGCETPVCTAARAINPIWRTLSAGATHYFAATTATLLAGAVAPTFSLNVELLPAPTTTPRGAPAVDTPISTVQITRQVAFANRSPVQANLAGAAASGDGILVFDGAALGSPTNNATGTRVERIYFQVDTSDFLDMEYLLINITHNTAG